MTSQELEPTLSDRVAEWVKTQGYPLEYRASAMLARSGFRVWQSSYVKGEKDAALREVDIVATVDGQYKKNLFRAANVIECKYTKDKPWVVFTSPFRRIAAPACVAQTMGNVYGSTLLWLLAGEKGLHTKDLFSTPDSPGFGGREVFSQKNDQFYNAIRGVVENCFNYLSEYDRHKRRKGKVPRTAVTGFPTLVIEGHLFECGYSEDVNEIETKEVGHIRCHWRGSPSWPLHATVDVVTMDSFEEFASKRADEINFVLEQMEEAHLRVCEFFKTGNSQKLEIERASRGVVGWPPLLREAFEN